MNDFQNNSYVLVKNFLDKQSVSTVSRYMEYSFKLNQYTYDSDQLCTSYFKYADPLMETILYNSKEELETITGLSLHPTYSYSRIYVKGDVLKPHEDRSACEISVSVHVATLGKYWPLWMQVPGKNPVGYILEPGDAIVYKGCEVLHWREKAVDTKLNAQFMLHYVNKNGPNADLKWDGRSGLGFKASHHNER